MALFKQNYRKNEKRTLTLQEENPEYKRIKYSLKLALRIINASFADNFNVT